MTNNDIKKALYKEKPVAKLVRITKDNMQYTAQLNTEEVDVVQFSIPLSDIGDAKFYPEMDAKLLIRWIS